MIRLLNKFVEKSFFPIVFKYITGAVFIALLIIGFSANSSDSALLKYLRNFNIANLLVWSYWWPIIIISAVFFGRIWCMVCPIELVTSFFAKIGFKKERPKWIKSGWAITIFYIIILFIGINGFAIHRNPFAMSMYLLSITIVAAFSGLIFKKNTFCRYICPVGHLLGLYSRFSFLGWRVKDKETCKTCKDLSCISNDYSYNHKAKSCGVDLYPANIKDNSKCILCGGCRKTCGKYQTEENPNRPNPGFTKINISDRVFNLTKLSLAESFFVLIVSGFVIYEVFVEWKISKSLIMYLPNLIGQEFNISNPFLFGIQKCILLYFLLPLLIWFIPFIVNKRKSNLGFKEYMKHAAIIFIPIMAAAHIIKALLKMTSRIPYFEHTFSDVSGLQNTQLFLNNQIELLSVPSFINNTVSLINFVVIVAGILLSFLVTKKSIKANNLNKNLYLIPIIYGSTFLIMLVLWQLS
ncbi:MAG: 4Fe-4S binding protein [Bacteroidales bacterium]|nr:4Fe-4S binding protein [Bacteroidales bacterium]